MKEEQRQPVRIARLTEAETRPSGNVVVSSAMMKNQYSSDMRLTPLSFASGRATVVCRSIGAITAPAEMRGSS